MPSAGVGIGKEVGPGAGAFHITNLTGNCKGPSSTGLKRKTRWTMGESTRGRRGKGMWLGGGNSPFLSGHRKAARAPGPGSDLKDSTVFAA